MDDNTGDSKINKHRDKLYKALSCTDRTNNRCQIVMNKLNSFNKMLKKTIREAKISYYKQEADYN